MIALTNSQSNTFLKRNQGTIQQKQTSSFERKLFSTLHIYNRQY